MNEIAILLAIASAAYALAQFLKLPDIPVFIAAGMSLSLTGFVSKDFGLENSISEGARHILEFGLIFLVFASGIELNPQRFKKLGKVVAWTAGLQFFTAMTIGFLTAKWLKMDTLTSIYIGGGLAASSTLVVIKQLRNRKATVEPFGRVVTGVVLLQDVILVFIIVALSRIDKGSVHLFTGLGKALLIGMFAWVLQKYVLPTFLKKMKPDEENLLLWLIALLLSFVGLAQYLDLPLISGAFAAGFVFSAFPLNGLLRGQITSLVTFFQAMFFVALGAMLGIPSKDLWIQALGYSAVVIIATPLLVAFITEWRGLNARSGIEAGLILAQTSEYSILLALSGLTFGHLNSDVFSVIALTTVITMSLTFFMGKQELVNLLLRLHPLKRKKTTQNTYENHVLLLGFGSAGMWLLKPIIAQGYQVLVIDDDASVCKELGKREIEYIRGDGADVDILKKAGAKNAKIIIASMRRATDSLKVIQFANEVPVIVRALEDEEANLIQAAGGIPVMSSHSAAEEFMKWFQSKEYSL